MSETSAVTELLNLLPGNYGAERRMWVFRYQVKWQLMAIVL